jgi:hypothetical protein
MTAINAAADRLVALQSASDYGWDWDVTGLTSHTASPSATNLYGVTALGLIYAYQKTGNSSYLVAAKNTADFMKYGNASAGDFWNGIPPAYTYYWGYSFDYKFLVEFSTVYGDPSYETYASNAWSWQKANILYYADGNQAAAYSHFVANGGGSDGYGSWQSSDYGLAAVEVGDTPWALSMASVINGSIGNIASSPTYKDLGMAWALKLLVTVDPTRATYGSGITTLISNLKVDQLADGSWHDGNPEGDAQTTAYAVMGLLTAGEYDAARKGADWLVGSQTDGGWLASSTEYSETDSEAMQALTAFVVQFTVANSPADHDSPSPAVGTTSYFVGDIVTASVTTPADDNGLGTRYMCTGYTGTGDLAAGGSGSSVSFTITQPTNITWEWIPQYYLTVDAGGHGIASGEGWYTANSNAQATITPLTVAGTTGTQYVFAGWSGDATGSGSPSDNILMDGPKMTNATWTTQYYVTYAANVPVTVPASEWVISGGSATGTFASPQYNGVGDTEYVFVSDNRPATITAPTTITATYNTFYLVTYAANVPVTVPASEWVLSGNASTGVFPTPVISGGTQYVYLSDDRPSTITAPITITAIYKTQYQVSFTATGLDSDAGSNTVLTLGGTNYAYNALPSGVWVDSGTTFSWSSPVAGVAGERFAYVSDSGLASPIVTSGTDAATYKTQWQVTFQQSGLSGDATGTILTLGTSTYTYSQLLQTNIWVDDGTTPSYTGTVPAGSGKRYVLTGVTGLTSPIHSSGTITGSYKTQYHVTFAQSGVGSDFTGTVVTIDSSNYGVSGLPVSFWWDQASGHSFSFASPLAVNVIKQYLWSSTSGLSTLQNDPLTVTASGSVLGNYVLQNAITFEQTGIGSDFTGTVVTIDGTSYGVSALPVSFNWTMGSAHSFAFQSPLVTTNATQYVWTNTTGLSSLQSGPINVTTYGNIVGNYKTQYHLTVSSYSGLVPAPSPASGWFDAGSQVTLIAPQTGHDPQGALYAFHGVWTVNGRDIQGNTLQITMNSSTVAIAWYVDPPTFGDINNDGKVDLADLVLVARHYGTSLGDPGYSYLYDLNGDGRIDLLDLAAVARAIQP